MYMYIFFVYENKKTMTSKDGLAHETPFPPGSKLATFPAKDDAGRFIPNNLPELYKHNFLSVRRIYQRWTNYLDDDSIPKPVKVARQKHIDEDEE